MPARRPPPHHDSVSVWPVKVTRFDRTQGGDQHRNRVVNAQPPSELAGGHAESDACGAFPWVATSSLSRLKTSPNSHAESGVRAQYCGSAHLSWARLIPGT